MKNATKRKQRRVAISLELDWGFKRHLEVYAGCQRYADEAGWRCEINPAVDRALTTESGVSPYDGVIARVAKPLADAGKSAKVPLVNVWMNTPVNGLPSVFPDCEAAGVMAAEHLIGRGFRHFAFLGYQRDIDSQLELNGFRGTTRKHGFRCKVCRFSRTSVAGAARGWEAFVESVEEWIDSWETPIGVFITSDLYCRYVIDLCRLRGLHVSQDVAIVGCSNEPEICNAPSPSLTSIDQGYGQIGYRAAAMLDRLMSGEEAPDKPELVAPAELIPRQTTDAYAADDPLVARALRFIAENSHERIQVKHVAAAVAATRRTLERRFRESVGRAIADEITRMRLERAKRRMVETDAPMKDVAKESGFRTADHFYKVFARVEGIPPTQYREKHQQAFPERV